MKRITHSRLAFLLVTTFVLGLGFAATALAAPTPSPNSVVFKERIFDDCPTSTLTIVDQYPDLLSIEDAGLDCFGFANLHNWRFSTDDANAAAFDNNSSFRASADLVISGTGNGEGGLQIAPWWSKDVDGRFNVRSTDGEIACFGGRLPFYSFTGSHGLRYAKGTTIHLEIIYNPHALSAGSPATIEYRLGYQGANYTSGALAFDQGNPAEDPPHGLWGMLNDGRVGGYFQVFNTPGTSTAVKATWTNVAFGATPDPNSAVVKTRIFDDCPTSTLTVVNDYPDLISIEDTNLDCFGFANLHNWRFSENGVDPATFNNNSQFRFGADLVISGTGNAEGGLQIAPWWSKDVDGRFNVRTTDGEIACFGGRLPFYSFSAPPNLVRYAKGDVIHLEVVYDPHSLTAADPATIEYHLDYNGASYSSGPLPFDQGNPAEDPPYGVYGILNDARAGGHFQVFMTPGIATGAKATWSNIEFSTCLSPAEVAVDISPNSLNLHSNGRWVKVELTPTPPATPADIDVASIRVAGVPVDASSASIDGGTLTVRVSRSALELALEQGDAVEVQVTGDIGSGCFEASDQIRVKRSHVSSPTAGSVLTPGSNVEVRWDTPSGVIAPTVAILASFDDGASWSIQAEGLANTGTYAWTVPSIASQYARIAVVLIESSDAEGNVMGVIGESGVFSISSPLAVGDGEAISMALRGAVPNPSRGLNVSFTLANNRSATLAVYDVTGRQVAKQDVGSLGAGRHTLSLARAGKLPVGVYLVQLVQGSRKLSSRAIVVE